MTTTTLAAVLRNAEEDFLLEEIDLEAPRDDEVVVRLEASGICHTDLVLRRLVPTPCILGHEGAGIVEQVGGNVTTVRPGDRVIISYAFCGECHECSTGQEYVCENNFPLSFSGTRLDGSSPVSQAGQPVNAAIFQQSSFARHAVTLARSVVKVDKDLPAEVLASITCAVFTGAGIAINSLGLGEGSELIVFGTGVVGLSAIMAARNLGASPIIAIDLNRDRLELAASLGATHTIDAAEQEVPATIKAILPKGAKHILDTTAAPAVWNHALESLGQGGEFVFVTVPQPWEDYALKVGPLMGKGASIRAIIQGSSHAHQLIPRLLEWYRAGVFPIDKLIRTYKLEDINQAITDLEAGVVIKPVLLMNHSGKNYK